MNMVSAIGIRAGIEKLTLSLEDLSNKDFISNIAELKAAREKIEQTSKDIAEDILAAIFAADFFKYSKNLLDLPNILTNKSLIDELLFDDCTVENVTTMMRYGILTLARDISACQFVLSVS